MARLSVRGSSDGPPSARAGAALADRSLGFFFLLEDCVEVHKPVRPAELYFPVDPVFRGASFSKPYQTLSQRLILERLYAAACLTLAVKAVPSPISHPVPELNFRQFAAQLQAHEQAFVKSR